MTKFFLCALLLTVLAVGQGGAAFPQAVWKSAWHCDLAAGSLWHHCHLLIDTGPSCFKYQWVFCVPCLIVSHLFLHLPPILIKKNKLCLICKATFWENNMNNNNKKTDEKMSLMFSQERWYLAFLQPHIGNRFAENSSLTSWELQGSLRVSLMSPTVVAELSRVGTNHFFCTYIENSGWNVFSRPWCTRLLPTKGLWTVASCLLLTDGVTTT